MAVDSMCSHDDSHEDEPEVAGSHEDEDEAEVQSDAGSEASSSSSSASDVDDLDGRLDDELDDGQDDSLIEISSLKSTAASLEELDEVRPHGLEVAPAAGAHVHEARDSAADLEPAGAASSSTCAAECERGDGAAERDAAPATTKRKRKKPPKDGAAAARKRLRQRQRKEAKAARKARKSERARDRQRRGAGQDLEAFLARTLERLQAKAAEAIAEAVRATSAAAAAESPQRGHRDGDVQSFLKRTRGRMADRATLAEAAAAAQKAARTAEEAAAAASAKLEDFRQKTQERLANSMLAKFAHSPADGAKAIRRRRIAIVGAGPVGLWIAVLLAQKHRYADSCGSLAQWPDAPEIVLMEGRAKEAHCARTDIRISLSPATCNLLNARAKSKHFCTGMPVAEIEARLLKRLRKIAPQSKPLFGQQITDPAALATSEGFDCVLWAGGRRSLDDHLRQTLGCDVQLTESARVLVFQFRDLEVGGSIHSDLAIAAQQATEWRSFKVLLRPGVKGVCDGWLWLFGLPPDAVAAKPSQDMEPGKTFREALEPIVDQTGPNADTLLTAADVFQQRIRPKECTARWVDAAYWSSARSVCDLGELDSGLAGCPFLVLGDALCGKPFYTGTTLNGHLKDVAATIDEIDWIHDGQPLGCSRFQAHERRYQEEIHRVAQFERRCCPAPAPAPAQAPPPPQPQVQSPKAPKAPASEPLHADGPLLRAQLSPPKTPPKTPPRGVLRTASLPRLGAPGGATRLQPLDRRPSPGSAQGAAAEGLFGSCSDAARAHGRLGALGAASLLPAGCGADTVVAVPAL